MRSVSLIIFLLMLVGEVQGAVVPQTTTRPLMLVPARLATMQSKYSSNHSSWVYMKGKADQYLTGDIYTLYAPALGELAAAETLAYMMTGNTTYRDRAREMIWARYFDDASPSKWDYQNRNGFRSGCMWATLVYDWLYNDLSAGDKETAQTKFKTWGQYWESYIAYPALNGSFSAVDTDEGTSLTSNILLLAMTLHGDDIYANTLFDLSDGLLADVVVGTYMDNQMKGGLWAEGNDYSPHTMIHWLMQYAINKESRLIGYPNNYINDVIKAQIYTVFPAQNAVYMYGDSEQVLSSYRGLADDHRYSLFLFLADLSQSQEAQYFINQMTPPTDSYGIWRFLLEVDGAGISPAAAGWGSGFLSDGATGQQFVSVRSGWGNSDLALYFRNSKYTVDHVHKDSLDFALVRGGDILTKESSGYAGVSWSSLAHNTVLVENVDSGNSAPTLRPLGYGTTQLDSGENYHYINAEAAPHYNMGGYYAENYVNKLNRKIVFVPPYTIIADFVAISTSNNCTWSRPGQAFNQECAPRWKKLIQHFPTQPTLSNGVYSAVEGSSKIFYKVLSPAVDTTIVDESVLWAAETQAAMPTSQRNWHLSSAPVVDSNSLTFLSVLEAAENGAASMAPTAIIDGYGGFGVVINGTTVAMFTKDPAGAAVTALSYTVDTTGPSTHYIADLTPGTIYSVSIDGGAAVNYVSSSAGLIVFSNPSFSPHNYSITQAGDSTPPSCSSFSLPGTSQSSSVSISALSCTDNLEVTGYYLSESSVPPTTGNTWISLPSTYTVAGEGSRTVYVWARDAAGNISTPLNATVTVTLAGAVQFTNRAGKSSTFTQGSGQVRFTQ